MSRIHVPIELRWSDLDAYGHVNNARMLTLLEEARVRVFWRDPDSAQEAPLAVIDASDATSTRTVIARQECEYLVPIPHLRAPLDVQLWLAKIGGASIEIGYEVFSAPSVQPPVLYTRAATTIVLVDAESMRPRRITDAEREAWAPYLGEPVAFGARR
ncbi:MAG: acyl-CoA thioesterase [Actinomycetales bacterium]|nr:acyl-CoA thioesterase [Actinomycetales bacterium]